jgi:hypothetical protein
MNAPEVSLTTFLALTFLVAPPALSQGRLEAFGNSSPGTPPAGTGFVQVDAGTYFNLAIHADGSLWAWGSDSDGQVSSKPNGYDFTFASAGGRFGLALRADGSLESWGDDTWGPVSGAPTVGEFTQVAAGYQFGVAIDADGFLSAWGNDWPYGVVTNTPTDSGYVQVAAGLSHAVALRADGTLVSWGEPTITMPTPTGAGFVQIAAGRDMNIALKEDGSVETWGANTAGGLITNTPTDTGYLDIAAAWDTLFVQKPNGLIHAWGNNQVTPNYGVDWFSLDGGAYHAVAIWELDCNYDGTSDYTEIESGESQDCNGNEVPDSCDIKSGFSYDIDGNGIPDECMPPALSANVYELSLSAGGVQDLFLAAPTGADVYLLLGSVTGTSPGITAGGFTLPLNEDAYLHRTLASPNLPPLSGSFGTLSGSGTANAAFTMPLGLAPGLVGLTVHHAFVTVDVVSGGISFVSNAAPLDLTP